MDYFIYFWLFIIFFVIVGYLGSEADKKTKLKQETFKRENSENIDKFLNEISSFKEENSFSNESVLKIKDFYEVWYFWTNKSSLLSVHYLGEQDNTNNLRKAQTDYLWTYLRGFMPASTNSARYVPINYNEFDKFRGIKIPLKDIVYFTEKGEVIQNTSVSGGGSSLGGAIVGGVLAGGLGAIIGSRKKINSEVVTTDNREVYLVYYEGKTITKKKFGYKMLEVFDKLIPEKNYEFIQLQSLNSNLNKSKNRKKNK
jgi:hypothetical protein